MKIEDIKIKELINDKRLTLTMERIRSGRTQQFREKNPEDRTFIDRDNCDVSLEHENKEMYAKLIDDKWYWVSGCNECNGLDRNTARSYIECDKHDRCSVCSISRKEIKGSVWGGLEGWVCNVCHEYKKLQRRNKAFTALDSQEPDCEYMDDIICPHCGTELSKDDVYEDED